MFCAPQSSGDLSSDSQTASTVHNLLQDTNFLLKVSDPDSREALERIVGKLLVLTVGRKENATCDRE